jgi:Rieske Fe-S protein
MTLINGDKLTIEPVFSNRKATSTFALSSFTRRRLVCAHKGCGVEFQRYTGGSEISPGVGLCPAHRER